MIAVTGATGNVGGALVRQLHAAGQPVRALSRNPERLDPPPGVPTATADLSRPETLIGALDGADAVFLYAAQRGEAAVADAVRRAGVGRVVLLSSGAVDSLAGDPAGANPIGEHHRRAEEAIEAAGLAWTFLRPHAFATNTLRWAPQIRADGVVRDAYPESTSAPIHEADIAEVALRALTGRGHAGRIHRMTGPESLTTTEMVQQLGQALGRTLTCTRIPVEQAAQAMAGAPEPIVRALLSMQAASVGRAAQVHPTVAEITGRPARTFAQWAGDHADDFR